MKGVICGVFVLGLLSVFFVHVELYLSTPSIPTEEVQENYKIQLAQTEYTFRGT
jgi:hypothetical protein